MKKLFAKQKLHWTNRTLVFSTLSGMGLFIASLFVSNAATNFATERAATNVSDLIISNIPVFNVDFIVNEVAMGYAVFVFIVVLFFQPKTMPFVLKSAALFIFIRSAFIMLTHLGPFPTHSYIDQTAFFSPLNIGSDFFFSGHTGLPFLIALIFWKNKFIGYISLGASILFGVSVLLGHLHYSIDVFAAFFITYTIFIIAQKFFPKDFKDGNEISA
jgi:membrane-associated phospholipid phosphatase